VRAEAEALAGWVASELDGRPALRSALAARMRLASTEARELAHVMVHETGSAALARDLSYVWRQSTLPPAERTLAGELLESVIRYATDLRQWIGDTRGRLNERGATFELRCRNETMAEVHMAGVDGRSLRFQPGDAELIGVAMVRRPAGAYGQLLDASGSRAAELVEDIVSEFDEKLPGSRARYRFEDRCEAIDTRLDMERDGPLGDRCSHYLVWVDDDAGDADARWREVSTAIAARLPALILVRLTGGIAELRRDETVFHALHRVRQDPQET